MSKCYTVQQLAGLSGVSVRTLHHYDRIGLLVPAFLGDNGYRYYRSAELLRLQQILLFREFGIPLATIARLLMLTLDEQLDQLKTQRATLLAEAQRYRLLAESIDRTIDSLTSLGETKMAHEDLYKGFGPDRQAAYRADIAARYGADTVERAERAQADMGTGERQAMMDELVEIELALAHQLRDGVAAEDARLAPLVARHRAWVGKMWGRPCTPEAHAGLADMYAAHPDFRQRYESIAPGLSDYVGMAIKAHVQAD